MRQADSVSGVDCVSLEPRAILLDLGGVLIDVSFERTLQYWHGQANVPQARSQSMTGKHDLATALLTDAATDLAYERHERGEIDFSRFIAVLDDKLQLNLSEAQWQHGWNAALGGPLPGALEFVRSAASQWPVYLFSNTNATHHAHWAAQQHELLAPMRAVFVSNELGLRKPDSLAYQAVAAQIGVDTGRIFFFDDRQENVDGARQAGLQAFHANSPTDVARVLQMNLVSIQGTRTSHDAPRQ